jgi:hypothetical protein
MTNELSKLNKSQRTKLRDLFGSRKAMAVFVSDDLPYVTIDFGKITHWVLLGPRGKVENHTFG